MMAFMRCAGLRCPGAKSRNTVAMLAILRWARRRRGGLARR